MQLLINHTNERLQLYFLHQTLRAELELYRTEGIPIPAVDLEDNASCVDLVGVRSDLNPPALVFDAWCCNSRAVSAFVPFPVQPIASLISIGSTDRNHLAS